MRVNHNIPALNAWRQGTITQRSMSKSLERLSSGLRINRAADDAAGLAISEKMRAQIKGLDQATRNAQDGISLIQTAEGALNETHSILQRMRELSVQAANDTYTSEDRQEIQKEISQLTSEIDRISATTEFNNKKLLDGSTSALVSTDKLSTKVFMRGGLRVLDQFGQKARGGGNFKLDIEATAGQNEIQKSDIFKVKHDQGGEKTINSDSNISDFEMTGSPSGNYEVNTVDVSVNGGTDAVQNASIVVGDTGSASYFEIEVNYAEFDRMGANGNNINVVFSEITTAAGTAGTAESASFDSSTNTLTITYVEGLNGANTSTLAEIISGIDVEGFAVTNQANTGTQITSSENFKIATAVASLSAGATVTAGTTMAGGVDGQIATAVLEQSAGGSIVVTADYNGPFAGSYGDTIRLEIDTAAATTEASYDETTKVLTVGFTAGATASAVETAISGIDGFTATAYTGTSAAATGDFVFGTVSATSSNDFTDWASDGKVAEASISGQFQQTTTNGNGLIDDIILNDATKQNGLNASMYFEVTAKDDVNNTITFSAFSQEYDRNADYTEVSRTNMVLNTTASNTVTVGDATFTLDLATQNHFTVGDKFGLEIQAAANATNDQVIISDNNGNSRQWTFTDGSLDDATHTFKSYYLDSDTGDVKLSEAETDFTSSTFAEVPTIEDTVHVNGSITTVVGDNLSPNAEWTVTESESAGATANASGTIEKNFTSSGVNLLSTTADNALTANASVLMEVIGKDGNNVMIQTRAHIITETGGSSYYEDIDTYDTSTSGVAAQIAGLSGNVTFDFADIDNISVGDKATMYFQAQTDATSDDSLTISRQFVDSETGDPISGSTISRKYVFDDGYDLSSQPNAFTFFELDETTGTTTESTLGFTGSTITNGATTFTTSSAAVEYSQGLSIGDVANGETTLYDVDKFWDASGNFILESPKTIKLVQGNGEEASFTISGEDSFDDVVDKLNTAIGNGLGQNDIAGISNASNYASFVTEPDSTGFETVEGTIVIRSAVAGDDGEITFVGDDDVLNALSLTTIQDSSNNSFTVDVTNAHTGEAVATDVQLATNELTGVVHENVDVEFAANTGIQVSWDSATNNFNLIGGATNAEDTFVHLADRTMVLHIGANQKQDIGTGIGDMSASALGVDNIQVTSNPLANDAIGKIDDAIGRVSGERSKLGAVQNRLDHTINNLGVTMENLTAAESRIRDADMAKEMMEFTKLQILSQSANAMLSQANQLPNNVLQLLR